MSVMNTRNRYEKRPSFISHGMSSRVIASIIPGMPKVTPKVRY